MLLGCVYFLLPEPAHDNRNALYLSKKLREKKEDVAGEKVSVCEIDWERAKLVC